MEIFKIFGLFWVCVCVCARAWGGAGGRGGGGGVLLKSSVFEIFCNFIYSSLTSFNIIVQHVEASDQIDLDSTI